MPRVPPAADIPHQNIEAEQAVLGSMLLSREAIIEVSAMLSENDFYREQHKLIYRAMLDLFCAEQPVDLVTVGEKLRVDNVLPLVGGITYLSALANAVPTAANAEHYARIVRDCKLARDIQQLCLDIPKRLAESPELGPVLEELQARTFELNRNSGNEVRHLKDVVAERFLAYSEKAEPGLMTGLTDLDGVLNGLHRGKLVVIAGRPSMGKSSLMRCICRRVAGRGVRSLIYTLEMTAHEQADALVAAEARIDTTLLDSHNFGEKGWQAITNACKVLPNLAIMLNEKADTSAEDIRAGTRRLKLRYPDLGLVAVDYLQILRAPKAESRVVAVSEMSRLLKVTARELDIPVIAVSQLSRQAEHRDNKRPGLADLRESGSIEQDADVVMLLYREDYYKRDTPKKGITEVIIAKNRNGPTGTVELKWLPQYTTFESLDKRHEEESPWSR